MSPSICSLSITSSGPINGIFPRSHSPVVFPVCVKPRKKNFEAKSLSAALTERVSVISYLVKLEFSFMKNVPLRWETILLLTPKGEKNTLQGNWVQVWILNHLHLQSPYGCQFKSSSILARQDALLWRRSQSGLALPYVAAAAHRLCEREIFVK